MNGTSHRELDTLEKACFLLIALQVAIFAKICLDLGFDRASDGFPMLVVSTALLVAGQRRLAAHPPNRGAAGWLLASRVAALAMLTLGTLAVGYFRLVPEAAPAPGFVVRGLFALMWIIIALKGAAMGKLKPGSAMGLRVFWTRDSRLAWDKAHRALGRVLFWGGLAGVVTSLAVAPPVSFLLWFSTIALGLTLALAEGRRSWRLDPERGLRGRDAC